MCAGFYEIITFIRSLKFICPYCLSSDINAEKSQCKTKEDVLGTMDTMTRESVSLDIWCFHYLKSIQIIIMINLPYLSSTEALKSHHVIFFYFWGQKLYQWVLRQERTEVQEKTKLLTCNCGFKNILIWRSCKATSGGAHQDFRQIEGCCWPSFLCSSVLAVYSLIFHSPTGLLANFTLL